MTKRLALWIALAAAAQSGVAAELDIGRDRGDVRWTLDTSTLTIAQEGNTEYRVAVVYSYGPGSRDMGYVAVVGCDKDFGELIVRHAETGKDRAFSWYGDGERVYDAVARAMCHTTQ
jgi:hypothetical protein